MKSLAFLVLLLVSLGVRALEPGDRVDNFRLLDHRGISHELHYLSDRKAVVIMVHGNGCPVVRQALPALRAVRERFEREGVTFLLLDSHRHDDRAAVTAEAISTESEERVNIDLKKILNKPRTEEDLILQEGDIIRIPKQLQTVRIGGEVAYPNTTRFTPGLNFLDYISRAGGFSARSIKRRSFVIYANGNVKRTKRFMFFNSYPRVEPGSEIIVPLKTKADVSAQQVLTSMAQIIAGLSGVTTILLLVNQLTR